MPLPLRRFRWYNHFTPPKNAVHWARRLPSYFMASDSAAAEQGCFLCQPDIELVYAESETMMAMCGLGPIVDGYTVIGTREHVRSSADAVIHNERLISFTESVRAFLTQKYGSCLLTEHGRLPICRTTTGADPHCFHAHFLLFPNAPEILSAAATSFARTSILPSLAEALELGRREEEYVLISPAPDSYAVFTRPGPIMRQFTRFLVANSLGEAQRASWSHYPERKKALSCAAELRGIVPNDIRCPQNQ